MIRQVVNTYFDTRGSYRRTADSIGRRIGYMQLFRIIDRLGRGCKSPAQLALELRPAWSGMLGLDGKVIKVDGEEIVHLIAVDLGTQDVVDCALVEHEDYASIEPFLREIRDEIGYTPDEAVIDLDPAWREAVRDVFPYTPIQLCVVHFERIVDRTIPKRKRTPRQNELKGMIRNVLYARSEEGARDAFVELMKKRGRFRDKNSKYVLRSLRENFEHLITHFRIKNSFRTNNITESVNDKIEMKLKMIRGYKRARSAKNSLELIVMHYRFKPFSSCRKKEHNGKSPLNLAGVDTSKLDWITYSQKDTHILNQL